MDFWNSLRIFVDSLNPGNDFRRRIESFDEHFKVDLNEFFSSRFFDGGMIYFHYHTMFIHTIAENYEVVLNREISSKPDEEPAFLYEKMQNVCRFFNNFFFFFNFVTFFLKYTIFLPIFCMEAKIFIMTQRLCSNCRKYCFTFEYF